MNWTKGFNRAFVILAVGWIVFLLLVYPFVLRTEDEQTYLEAVHQCSEQMVKNTGNGLPYDTARDAERLCNDIAKNNRDGSTRLHSVATWFSWKNRLLLPLALAVLILPPALIYGLFRLGWAILDWVGRGFREPAS